MAAVLKLACKVLAKYGLVSYGKLRELKVIAWALMRRVPIGASSFMAGNGRRGLVR